MEDSEQRKKRLKEMRTEADLAEGSSGGVEGFGIRGGVLSNPLLETPSAMPSPAAPRFNYYTDPMNAFSTEKRSNNANVQAAPPDYLPPSNFGGSPMPQFSSPRHESINRQMPPSPNQVLPTAYGNPVWNGPRGPPPHYNFPFHPAGGGPYPGPRFEPPRGPLYNSAQGMNQWPNHSPNPSQGYRNSPGRGRGRGFGHNTGSPVSGRGNGQGSSSHGRWSNEDRAGGRDQFYKRSMVEDPWKSMEPVLWKATNAHIYSTAYTPDNSKPWTPSKSSSTKGEGGSSAVFVKPNSGPSLSEYLAAALNEAANSEENV